MEKWIVIFLAAVLLAGCQSKEAVTEIRIFAASSLSEMVKDVEKEFEQKHVDWDITVVIGSSTQLMTQIDRGAEFDLFLSASERDIDTLLSQGFIEQERTDVFARNDLVLAGNGNTKVVYPDSLFDTDVKFVAIGEPRSVPLGRQTKAALEKDDLWRELDGKVAYGRSAGQVLHYIKNDQADLGIVYGSDARYEGLQHSPIDPDTFISYPYGVSKSSDHIEEIEEIIAWLVSKDGQKLVKSYGFLPVE